MTEAPIEDLWSTGLRCLDLPRFFIDGLGIHRQTPCRFPMARANRHRGTNDSIEEARSTEIFSDLPHLHLSPLALDEEPVLTRTDEARRLRIDLLRLKQVIQGIFDRGHVGIVDQESCPRSSRSHPPFKVVAKDFTAMTSIDVNKVERGRFETVSGN